MAKNAYPSTTLQPVQTLDFILENGLRVSAVFLPQPDQTGQHVAHVALALIHAGSTTQLPLPPQCRPQTVMDAASLATKFAQSEATRVNSAISTVRLSGQEFLEKQDVVQLVGSDITVEVL